MSGAEVVDDEPGIFMQFFKRGDVTFRKVDDVDIIPDARTVFRGIIVAENVDFFKFSDGNLRDIRPRLLGIPFGSSPISPLSCAPMGLKYLKSAILNELSL